MNKANKKKRAIRGREHYYSGFHMGVKTTQAVIDEKLSRFDRFETDGWDTEKWSKFIKECVFDSDRVGRYARKSDMETIG